MKLIQETTYGKLFSEILRQINKNCTKRPAECFEFESFGQSCVTKTSLLFWGIWNDKQMDGYGTRLTLFPFVCCLSIWVVWYSARTLYSRYSKKSLHFTRTTTQLFDIWVCFSTHSYPSSIFLTQPYSTYFPTPLNYIRFPFSARNMHHRHLRDLFSKQCQFSAQLYHSTALSIVPVFPKCKDLNSEVL